MWLSGTTVIISCISSSDGYNLCSLHCFLTPSLALSFSLLSLTLSHALPLTLSHIHFLLHSLLLSQSLVDPLSDLLSLQLMPYLLLTVACLLCFFFTFHMTVQTTLLSAAAPPPYDPTQIQNLYFAFMR